MKATYTASAPAVNGALNAVDSWAIRVHQERCAKVRNRNVSCEKCAEACTSGCIGFVDGKLSVDEGRCIGCGTCATVCPTCALESLNPTDDELLAAALGTARAHGGATAVLACRPALDLMDGLSDKGRVAEVVCLGRVDESLLLALEARGVRTAELVCANCGLCRQENGRQTARLVADTAQDLSAAWGGSLRVVLRDYPIEKDLAEGVSLEEAQQAWDEGFGLPCRCAPLSRSREEAPCETHSEACGDTREHAEVPSEFEDETHGTGMRFFWSSRHARQPKDGMHVMADGTLPHFVPNRRERTLDALAQIGSPKQESVECRLWSTVVIDATRCTSCRMCATFCPTGAIGKFDDPDGSFGVMHTPADCVSCGSCLDICPSDAIVVRPSVRTQWLDQASSHRYLMQARPVNLTDNPHQILDTMRQTFPGDLFER